MKSIRSRIHSSLSCWTIIFLSLSFSSCEKENSSSATDPNSNEKPNILVIIADDMGIDVSPGYALGARKPNMPTLQNLIDNGISFDNFWVNPLCSPTRAAILTGKYGYRTGVLNVGDIGALPSDEKILHKYIGEETNRAYTNALIGKWHLSANNDPNHPTQLGVEYFAGMMRGSHADYNSWQLVENGESNQSTEYSTTKFTSLAIDWIADQNKPWFLWLAYTAPHFPLHVPDPSMHSPGALSSDPSSIDANPISYYLAAIETLDFQVNRLLSSMSDDERENTIIIFIGDNGTPRKVIQSYSVGHSKGSLYEGGIRTPLIISGKGVTRQGQRESDLISGVDLFATISAMAGIDVESHEDSRNFISVLSDIQATSPRKFSYSEISENGNPNNTGYTIRNERYKLIVWEDGREEMYDMNEGPLEGVNILELPVTPEVGAAKFDLEIEANTIRN